MICDDSNPSFYYTPSACSCFCWSHPECELFGSIFLFFFSIKEAKDIFTWERRICYLPNSAAPYICCSVFLVRANRCTQMHQRWAAPTQTDSWWSCPEGFWDQTSCNPQAKLKLPAQSSSSYCRQHVQAHPGEREDCTLQDQGEPSAGRWCKQQRTWPQACPWCCFCMQPSRALCFGNGFSSDCTLTSVRFGPPFVVYPNPG